MVAAAMVGRAVLCLLMANKINSPLLYPLAFGALVLSKGQSVAKSALVPAVVDSHDELVLANSRLTIISVLGAIGRRADRRAHPQDRGRGVGAAHRFAGVRPRHGVRVRHPAGQARRQRRDGRRTRRAARAEHRHRRNRDGSVALRRRVLHVLRRVRAEAGARAGMGVRRGAGRERGRQRPRHRRSRRSCARSVREEWMLAGALLVPALPLVFAARDYGRVSLVVAAATVAAATACGRVAFDSLLQRDGSEAVRGRAFARFETRFQLVWVAGGVGAVVFPGRRARRDLRGRGRAAVRRPVVRRRVPPDRAAKYATVAAAARARTSGCPSRSAPSKPDELDDLLFADQRGFGDEPKRPATSRSWARAELDRTRVAFESGRMVGVSRTYSFELTMPGGALLPAAAVSWVSVLPTHRRRGVLTRMMAAMHDDARERGEPAAILTASESSIYGRFGYGVAAWRLAITAERARIVFARPDDDGGTVRLVPHEEADARVARRSTTAPGARAAGMVTRPDFWWPQVFWDYIVPPEKASFFAVHAERRRRRRRLRRLRDRRRLGRWAPANASCPSSTCRRYRPRRGSRLWRFVFGVDLIGDGDRREPARRRSVASRRHRQPACPRRLRERPPLARAAGSAARCSRPRTYAVPGRVVIEVHAPDGSTVDRRGRIGGGRDELRRDDRRARSRVRLRGARHVRARWQPLERAGRGRPGRRRAPRSASRSPTRCSSPPPRPRCSRSSDRGRACDRLRPAGRQVQPEPAPATMPNGPLGQRKQSVISWSTSAAGRDALVDDALGLAHHREVHAVRDEAPFHGVVLDDDRMLAAPGRGVDDGRDGRRARLGRHDDLRELHHGRGRRPVPADDAVGPVGRRRERGDRAAPTCSTPGSWRAARSGRGRGTRGP